MTATIARFVVVIRHGERLDYVMRDAGQNWIPTSDRPWDPPLTEHGRQQARALGRELPGILKDLCLPSIAAVYTSPFWRCRQTSAELLAGNNYGTDDDGLKIKVELGLTESMNENWYRSWAVPGTDGSWGYQKEQYPLLDLDPSTFHPAARKPVQRVLDWKLAPKDETIHAQMDSDYISKSILDTSYSLHPPCFESFKKQRSRMKDTLELLSAHHPNETIVLVSHGGPITHLYESLTGNSWKVHGESKYCSYSIYQQTDRDDNAWTPLVVNRVLGQQQGLSSSDKTSAGVNRLLEQQQGLSSSDKTSAGAKLFTWA